MKGDEKREGEKKRGKKGGRKEEWGGMEGRKGKGRRGKRKRGEGENRQVPTISYTCDTKIAIPYDPKLRRISYVEMTNSLRNLSELTYSIFTSKNPNIHKHR
jgi:hypothetical protein